jgi:transcriptional regulator with XRE-family HTH domain
MFTVMSNTRRRATSRRVTPDGEAIRALRGNLTQKDLAARLGHDQAWVSNIERGKPCALSVIITLGLYFGVSPDTLTVPGGSRPSARRDAGRAA